MKPEVFIFDLDGTLAASKSQVGVEMVNLLTNLTNLGTVVVISGGKFGQFKSQLFDQFKNTSALANVIAMPTCGSQMYRFDDGEWRQVYSESLSDSEKNVIIQAMQEVLLEANHNPEKIWGEIVEDRDSQIAMSLLGQEAPVHAKEEFGRDRSRMWYFHGLLNDKIGGDFDVKLGGSTTLDVTRKGIDKAYGINKLRNICGFDLGKMVFVGDRLEEGGNDYPVKALGVRSIPTSGPEETKIIIKNNFQ